jgi:hypothetical protein
MKFTVKLVKELLLVGLAFGVFGFVISTALMFCHIDRSHVSGRRFQTEELPLLVAGFPFFRSNRNAVSFHLRSDRREQMVLQKRKCVQLKKMIFG